MCEAFKKNSGADRRTTPVLTEAFHMLRPASIGSDRLRKFIAGVGLSVF
jgi:hypothetical protein